MTGSSLAFLTLVYFWQGRLIIVGRLYFKITSTLRTHPCNENRVFLTRKNLFLLQGTLFSLQGWVCREGVQTPSQKSTFEHLKFGSKTWKQYLETTNIFLHIDIQDKMHYFLEGKPPHHGQCVLWDPTKRTDSFVSLSIANFVASRLKWLQWLNVSTTPIRAMGCQQCLSLTVQLEGKHCRKSRCLNGVVDTFGQYLECPIL